MPEITAMIRNISIRKLKRRKYTIAASQKEPIHTKIPDTMLRNLRSSNLPIIYDDDKNR
jgi:hypothetical protein